MPQEQTGVEADRQRLVAAQSRGKAATTMTYFRLSGPGWLQSALTLGGGSLAGSLYLGVLGGMSLLWIQPLAMVLGIIMLSSIGYVTLSTGKRPFQAINEHVNPVLGWGWALATLMANIVWCMPQFSLANGVLKDNLFPELLGKQFVFDPFWDKVAISGIILLFTTLIAWSYSSKGLGLKLFELLLKLVVGMIVLCFMGVVFALRDTLNWGEIIWGFIPDPRRIFEPSAEFQTFLDAISSEHQQFWTTQILDSQRDKLIAAAATAVGINMTFLFPYSLLKRGWTSEFRGLVAFDLATGMFIPFLLATSCVVIASASQFHAKPVAGLVGPFVEDESGQLPVPTDKEWKNFRKNMMPRLKAEIGADAFQELVSGEAPFVAVAAAMPANQLDSLSTAELTQLKKTLGTAALNARIAQLPEADRLLGAMLVERDSGALATTIEPLVGKRVANLAFGVGVLGMAVSTIIMLMTISGFAICEMLNIKSAGWPFRISCLAAGVGALGPFFWSKAAFALAVPTSVFGLILLPVAYLTFFLLMNQKKLLGEHLPRGRNRVIWNLLMAVSAGIAGYASISMVWIKTGYVGMTLIGIFLGLALVVQFIRWLRPAGVEAS